MSYLNLQDLIRIRCGRRKVGDPTLNSQPGAHTGSTRKYIPGYSDSNIVYLDTASGNDSNDGSTELLAKLTYASAATAAGTTKKIRVINNGAALSTNITKPTEMKRGVSGSISSSLTAPVDTLTMAGATAFTTGSPSSIVWSPELKKLYAVSGTEVASSADGITYVVEGTLGFGATKALWTSHNKTLIIAGALGRVAYSTNGSDYTTVQLPTTSTLRAIIYSDIAGGYIAAGDDSYTFFSADGITWERSSLFPGGFVYSMVEAFGKIIAFDSVGKLATTKTGLSWETYTDPIASGYAIRAAIYMPTTALLIVGDDNGEIWSAPDLVTFTSRLSATANIFYDAAYSAELGAVVVCGQAKQFYRSYNGTSYTDAATNNYTAGDEIRGVCFSPLLGQCFSTGGNGGGTQRRSAYCPAFANTISASIAGFTVQAMQYSSTPTLYNCTLKQPGGLFNTENCRFTESGAHVSGNTQSHFGTLAEGDFNITCIPASQNAVALNCNTIAGRLSIFNGSSTSYEQIRDNIIEGGFYSTYKTVVLSGNLRGSNTNGLLSKSVRFDDPGFVDTTDYKLKRKTQGDAIDSPLVAAASYYVNEQGEQRDIGAWSLDDSALPYDYSHTFYIRKPAGQGLKPKKVPMASAEQGIDGPWDSTNEPSRASEYLTFQCTSVPIEDVIAQDFLESMKDLTCEVNLDPENLSPTTDIVVNGNHSIGDVVLNIDASTTIKSGMVLAIGGKQYFIMYTIGGASVTKLVLHKPLESAISDNATITPNEPVGNGTYQFVPQQRETPRPHAQEKEIALNLSWTFVRQYPQI